MNANCEKLMKCGSFAILPVLLSVWKREAAQTITTASDLHRLLMLASSLNHQLASFCIIPNSTHRLCLSITNWPVSHQLGFSGFPISCPLDLT